MKAVEYKYNWGSDLNEEDDMKDNLGDRIKKYESVSKYSLTPNSPLFIRIDGRAFHTYVRQISAENPFDDKLINSMVAATLETAQEMQGFKLAYTQSDEATFMLTDYDTHETQGWFGYELNKVVSLSASIFTAAFNVAIQEGREWSAPVAHFDSRAFTVPVEDAPNVFIWRQQDWERNSLQMLARSHFSHGELNKKGRSDMHEMLHGKGVNWAELNDQLKNGTFIDRDYEMIHDKMDYQSLAALIEVDE